MAKKGFLLVTLTLKLLAQMIRIQITFGDGAAVTLLSSNPVYEIGKHALELMVVDMKH